MNPRREPRSSKYQYLLLETACSAEMMEGFSNDDSVYNRLNPYAYSEELLDLEDELRAEFWRIINTCLTERQNEVVKLYADGYTQMEIAKALGVNQSSVVKCLAGNKIKDDNKRDMHVYGGVSKKVKRIAEEDPKIKDILRRMEEVRSHKW
jgi:DNA-binding CsgD family transcriptional regulator